MSGFPHWLEKESFPSLEDFNEDNGKQYLASSDTVIFSAIPAPKTNTNPRNVMQGLLNAAALQAMNRGTVELHFCTAQLESH